MNGEASESRTLQHPGLPALFVRLESLAAAVLVIVAATALGLPIWLIVALFPVFDLSTIGYLAGPCLGAWTYNAGHSYVIPAALGVTAVAGAGDGFAVAAAAWALHIAVDRVVGYGLKHVDHFRSTDLGTLRGPGARSVRQG